MIPLKDSIPRVHKSWALWSILVANLAVFIFQLGLNGEQSFRLFHLFGVVPARFFDPQWAMHVGYPPGGWWTLVSYTFLHGSWLHFLLNMWTLWIFADNVEDVMGPVRFFFFYFICGAVAAGAHMISSPGDTTPVVGASGAVAGIMGAYFLLYPHATVLTLIPIFIFPLFVNIPAIVYLGLWFASQIFSGLATRGQAGGGVAFWAHVGGFVIGLSLMPLFRIKSRCYYCYDRQGKSIPHKMRGRLPYED